MKPDRAEWTEQGAGTEEEEGGGGGCPLSKLSTGAELALSATNCQPCTLTSSSLERDRRRIFHNGAHSPGYADFSAVLNICDHNPAAAATTTTSG